MFSSLDRRPWLAGLLLALAGMGAVFFSMPHGAGLSPDSISYIAGGRSLARDHSLAGINSHWPPFYPFLLALAAGPHGSLFASAKLLCAAAAGLNVFVFHRLMLTCGWRALFALPLSACVALDPDFVNLHLMAWSEPIFLGLVLAAMLALQFHLQHGRMRALYAAALLFGLAALTRYAGLAFIAAAGLMLLWRGVRAKDDAARIEALLSALKFGVPAVLPLAFYVLMHGGSGGNGVRSFQFHPLAGNDWVLLLAQAVDWLGGPWIFVMVMCAVFVVAVRCRGALPPAARRLSCMALVFGAVYLAFVIVSITFFDAYIPLDGRILSPLKLMCYLSLFAFFSSVPDKFKVLPVVLAAAFMLCVTYPETRALAAQSSQEGFGFAQPAFARLPILTYLRDNHVALDACNSPELALLYLDSEVPMLPAMFDPTSKLPFPAYPREMEKLAHSGSTVAIFAPLMWRAYLPMAGQLRQAGFTEILYLRSDGTVLRHP